MEKFNTTVSPDGRFDLYNIKKEASKVVLTRSDNLYGNRQVKQVNMFLFKGELPQSNNLWATNKIAFIWCNPDGSFWWDTLSLSYEEAQKCSSKPETMIGLGFKIIPIQFLLNEVAYLMAA